MLHHDFQVRLHTMHSNLNLKLLHNKAECMHASIACLLLYEDYVWVSLGNAMKAKQSKANKEGATPSTVCV